MEEIINIANQTIEQLNEIIREEIRNTSTEETIQCKIEYISACIG